MSRTIRDAQLGTRAARGRLKPNREPHYRGIEPGLHLGYRKPVSGPGAWLARRRKVDGEKGYTYHPLGTADDFGDADGKIILDYKQAQDAARKVQVGRGIGTVAEAMEAYLQWLEDEGRPQSSIQRTRYNINTHILPTLGPIELAKLTDDRIERWQRELARKPARIRTRKGEAQRHRERHGDEDGKRARRATANRIRTTLNAALNRAFRKKHVGSDSAWRLVQPFKGVDKAKERYLSIAEAQRLINACVHGDKGADFRLLVQGALLCGGRYGGLGRVVVLDFNPDAAVLRLQTQKGDGSWRTYYHRLSDEAHAFFRAVCAGKRPGDRIFTHVDGRPWKKSHQQGPMRDACARAGIDPPISFNALRHTFASHAAMAGVPLQLIAEQLGHTDMRMVTKHYAHLAPDFSHKIIREKTPAFGIKAPGNVRPLR